MSSSRAKGLSKYRVMKKYGEVDVQLHTFLSSAHVGGDWSVSRPGRFIPSGRASGAIWIWRRERSSAGLEFGEKKYILIRSEKDSRNGSLVSVPYIRRFIPSIRRCLSSIWFYSVHSTVDDICRPFDGVFRPLISASHLAKLHILS